MRASVDAVLFDLLMAVMNSVAVWTDAARDRDSALAWRDAATRRMVASRRYVAYEELVADAATEVGLPASAVAKLFAAWTGMEPWPDAAAIGRLPVRYAFVTNCSARLTEVAARRSGLEPVFVLSAEEAGAYKPDAAIYRAATERLAIPTAHALFVAGSPYDAEGAIEAGLRAALVVRRTDQGGVGSRVDVVTSLDEIVARVG